MTKEFRLSVDGKMARVKSRYILELFTVSIIFSSFTVCLNAQPGF